MRLLAAIASAMFVVSATIMAVAFDAVNVETVPVSTQIETGPADEAKADVDLAGDWTLRLDPKDQGIVEQWFEPSATGRAENTVKLPGSLQAQGFGDDVSVETPWTGQIVDRSWYDSPKYAKYREPGNIKTPFWLQPDKHYVGAAWYAREVEVSEAWRGRRIFLTLERPHWETRVWVDGRLMGARDSLSTPHEYDLSEAMVPGKHRLSIRVDNRMIVDVGENAHSVSDHTQSNWNGIIGRLALTAKPPVWIDDAQVYTDFASKNNVQVYPDFASKNDAQVCPDFASNKKARVVIRIGNATGIAAQGRLSLTVTNRNSRTPSAPDVVQEVVVPVGQTTLEVVCPLDRAPAWDEFDPALNRMAVDLCVDGGEEAVDTTQVVFGLRDFATKGTQFTINGRPTFIRGTLECCTFPLTGYPATDVESWKRIMSTAKSYGLNSIRFHSWCPPEAAFVAADELGVYLQAECAAWSAVGDGQPIDKWLYAEGERITRAYGNHPSFVMMAYGNEPSGPQHVDYLTKWVNYWKAKDPRRLHTSAGGWPAIDENQYHNIPEPRIQGWGSGLASRINACPPETVTDYSDWVSKMRVPIVSHEIGEWCVYPNFDETAKYTGLLKAKNFEIFRDRLEANHMGDQARQFYMDSGKLQTLCYKEEIESALRTPGFGGFHLLGLQDFPGQGTALVGCVDAFWDAKDYVTAEQFRQFCNTTVLLARMGKRTWTLSETFKSDIEVAHFGPAPMENAVAAWRVVDTDGKAVASGRLPAKTIPIGNGIGLGSIGVPLTTLPAARKYALVVGLEGDCPNFCVSKNGTVPFAAVEGTSFENSWDFWVFPDSVETAAPAAVLVTESLNAPALERLREGGRVLLLIPPANVKSTVAIGFSSIFWNTAWTRGQAPHTLGITCDPKHPVFLDFLTDSHSDWQWWELVHGSAAMVLDDLPVKLRPLVQPIDTWFEARRLGLLFEAKVLGGKLLVSSMDLSSDLDHRIAARQMRYSVLQYMASDRCEPTVELSESQVAGLGAVNE